MKERNILKQITRYISFAGVAIVCFGCPHEHGNAALATNSEKSGRAFDLSRITCPGHPVDIKIEVQASPDVLADQDNLVIFGCEGDKIGWYTNDPTLKVTVALEGENAGNLFKGGLTLFVSGPDGKTPTGTVEKQKKYASVHKYSIWVTPPGHDPYHIDPHVIPMGK